MPLMTWTTAEVPSSDRFEYWREAVCRAVLNVSVARPRDRNFCGRISAQRTGTVSYVAFESSGHDILRNGREASLAGEESYLVSLQLSGNAHIRQNDCELVLTPGEIAVVEGWRPFSVGFDATVSRVLALVPRRMLAMTVNSGRIAERLSKLPVASPFGELIAGYMQRLSSPHSGIGDAVAEKLGQNLCNLLTIVCNDRPADNATLESLSSLKLDALCAFVRRNLHDPALTPKLAAKHLGISVRSLHKLLEPSGVSFGKLVLEQRLQACADLLRSRGADSRRIGDIAYALGFGDLSHFNHAFKARFGMPPREMRRSIG